MPLPLVIGLGIGITSGVTGVVLLIRSKSRIKEAKNRYNTRRAAYESAECAYKQRHKECNEILDAFGKLKLEATVTLGKAAEFIKKAKVKDRDFLESLELTPEKLSEWEGASLKALDILGGVVSSAVSGTVTAFTIYGLVGMLGTASTGTAIGTLTGIAAKNATLAWLGGGAISAGGGGMVMGSVVLGGFVVGPALLVSSFFASAKAAQIESKVEDAVAEMDRAEERMGKQLAYFDVALERIEELREPILKVESTLRQLLDEADAEKEEDVYRVAKTAKSLAELLDTSVIKEQPDA